MKNPIRRHFISKDNLEELEQELNKFTDDFNPADVLEVNFYVITTGGTMRSVETMVKPQPRENVKTTNEEQQYHDRFVAMVTYNQAEERTPVY